MSKEDGLNHRRKAVYGSTSAPTTDKSGIAGVKQFHRGRHKGKFAAFYQSPNGLVFTHEPRDTREIAQLDLIALKTRIYL